MTNSYRPPCSQEARTDDNVSFDYSLVCLGIRYGYLSHPRTMDTLKGDNDNEMTSEKVHLERMR